MITDLLEMKKVPILICLIISTFSVYGQDVVDLLLKAKANTESGNPDKAVIILNDALKTAKSSDIYLERAEANLVRGNYSEAISDYNEANKITPSSGEYGLSRIYALKRDVPTALYHLEMNLVSSLKKSEKVIMLDPAFELVQNSPQWRQFWKKEWYTDSEKAISEIEYYLSAGKTDESKSVLADLKKNYGNSEEALSAEASINLASGKYAEVVKVMTDLIADSPGNEKYLRILAKAQTGLSNPSGASVIYSQLLNAGVADAELLILRADCYRKTGENVKSLADIEKYLEYYPENRAALSLAGRVETLSGDNLKALEYFSRNLKLHPNDPECYIDRANSYLVAKSWDWAIKDYSMSLDLKPGNSDAWLNKGVALLNEGKTDDACHDFRRSFSLGNKRAAEYISNNCIK
jgi:tetratricopeptide (TPR) repeat protein